MFPVVPTKPNTSTPVPPTPYWQQAANLPAWLTGLFDKPEGKLKTVAPRGPASSQLPWQPLGGGTSAANPAWARSVRGLQTAVPNAPASRLLPWQQPANLPAWLGGRKPAYGGSYDPTVQPPGPGPEPGWITQEMIRDPNFSSYTPDPNKPGGFRPQLGNYAPWYYAMLAALQDQGDDSGGDWWGGGGRRGGGGGGSSYTPGWDTGLYMLNANR